MTVKIIGPSAAVTMMNLALYGDSYTMSTAEFANQLGSAQANAGTYANTLAAPFSTAATSTTAYATLVLDHMGINTPALRQAVVDYMNAAGIANRGIVTLQIGQILSTLELDPTWGAAAAAWNNEVTANFAEWTGTPVPTGTVQLTTGLDNIQLLEGQNAIASVGTFNPGDHVHGASGDVSVFLGVLAGTIASTVLGTLDNVNLQFDAGSAGTVVAAQWTSIDNINVVNSKGSMTLFDLQATSNDSNTGTYTDYRIDDFKTAGTTELNFDSQAADAANTNVNLTVKEVSGNVKLSIDTTDTKQAIENVTMTIADTVGKTSNMASFSAQGIKTLNMNGGTAGLKFGIVAALDAGLETIAAGTVASDMSLNVSASTKAMNITLGTGNDTLTTGDTLGPLAERDTIVGGKGDDLVTAVFTTAGTRQPVMSEVENMTLTFNANATVNFGDTNDLQTINVLTSPLNRISLEDMDATVTTINVTGLQGSNQAHDFWYVGGKTLTLNWMSDVADDVDAGELVFRDIQTVTINHSGEFQTFFTDVVGDGNDSVFSFDNSLKNLTINNNGVGDMYLMGASGQEAIAGTRMMQNLSINATGGDIAITGDVDTIKELRTLTLTAAGGNYLALDDIGSAVDSMYPLASVDGFGERLELVNITAGKNSLIQFDDLRADESTVSTFNVTVGVDALVEYGDIITQDISDATIKIAQSGELISDTYFLAHQGDKLTVTGAGEANDFVFSGEAFKVMDFSGLTGDSGGIFNGTEVLFWFAEGASTVTGTVRDDWIAGGRGGDTLNGNDGNDLIQGDADGFGHYFDPITAAVTGGADVIDGGVGNDWIYAGGGLDVVTGGAGRDVFQIGLIGANRDTITDFQQGNVDSLMIDLGDINMNPANGAPLFNLSNGADASVAAGNAVFVQSVNGATQALVNANVWQVTGATFASQAAVEIAIEAGGGRQITTLDATGSWDALDAILIAWADTSGNTHISQAVVVATAAASATTTSYNFNVTDVAVLTGVPAVDVIDFAGFMN